MMRLVRAVSLTEILVVTAIVVALCGILLPVLIRAKAVAGEVPIPVAMRQLVSAQTMYAADNDERMALSNSKIGGTWLIQLTPYFPGVTETVAPEFRPVFKLMKPWQTGYAMNGCLGSKTMSGVDGSATVLVAESQERAYEYRGVLNFVGTFLLTDVDERDLTNYNRHSDPPVKALGPLGSSRRHSGGYYGSVDGRVVWARPSQIATTWPPCAIVPATFGKPQFGATPAEALSVRQ